MNFKRGILAGALAGLALCGAQSALAAPLVTGDTVTVANGVYGTTNGGEFAMTYAGGSFVSFCLERNEFLSYGPSYTVTLNSAAIAGGYGVLDNSGEGNNGTSGVSDPLSTATAWLFTNYLMGASGALSGWTASDASANKAQEAIWWLENEDQGANPSWNNSWVTEAIAAVGGGWVNPSGLAHVYVLNMKDSSGAFSQDQLYIAAIPEPETYAMLLAGLGLMGFVARRRTRKSLATA